MHSPSRRARLLLLAAVLAVGLEPSWRGAAAQPQEQQQTITTGQQLADAVASYGRRNADTTLLVPANTTLRLANATFTSVPDAEAAGGKAFSSGTLTVQGAGAGSSVLDSGMRAGLVPPWNASSSGSLAVRDLSIINSCAVVSVRGPGLSRVVQTLLALLSMTPVRRTVDYQDVVLYMRQAEMKLHLYGIQMQRSSWPTVVARYQAQLDTLPNMMTVTRRTTAHSYMIVAQTTGAWAGRNVTYKTTADPDDPVLQSMRRDGTLLPIRWCDNGSLVPSSIAQEPYDAFWGPLFGTDTSGQAVEALREAARVAVAHAAAQPQLPVPAVFINAPVVSLSEADAPGGIALSAPLQLWGPFNDVPADPMPVPVLRLAGRATPLFNLSGTGQVFITRVVLDATANGTASSSSTASPGATTSPRSLSLSAAFVSAQDAATAAGDAPVQLENVTLVLPPAEYMALLTLATDKTAWSVRHCMDAPTLQLAAALNGSAAVLDASAGLGSNGGGSGGSDAAALAALWQSLLLSRFTGWGVNGTQLRLVPAAALPTAVTAACVPGGAEEGGGGESGGLSGGAIAGIVVGSVVGAALLVGGGVWAVRERRRRRDSARRSHSSDLEGALGHKHHPHHHAGASPHDTPGSDALPPTRPHSANGTPSGTLGARSSSATTGNGGAAALLIASRAPGDESGASLAAAAAGGGGGGGGEVGERAPGSAAAVVSMLQAAEQRLLGRSDTAALVAELSTPTSAAPLAAAEHLTPSSPREAPSSPAAACASGSAAGPAAAAAAARRDSAPRAAVVAVAGPPSLLGRAHELLLSSLPSHVAASRERKGAGGGASSGGRWSGGAGRAGSGTLDPVKEATSRNASLQEAAQTANKVVIHSLLGRGSSGTVYVGEWRGLPVAVKTMVYEATPGEEQQAAAVMETAISASVGHRNVVATYHYDIKRVTDKLPGQEETEGLQVSYQGDISARGGQNGGGNSEEARSNCSTFKIFLIQELCQSSMQDVVEQRALYDPGCSHLVNQVLMYSLLTHIATGLEYLHGLNIIHGDLTPANVLLKLDYTEPCGIVAKLADFGLSRRLDAQATHVSNFAAGTPFYVAPEVVHHKRTSPASDIFSLGVITWQVLSGHRPWVVDPDGSSRCNPAFPALNPDVPVPRPVHLMLLRCLQQEPRLRPSAAEVRAVMAAQLPHASSST